MPELKPEFYCATCEKPAPEPLVCGDCSAVICRVCGTPLERVDDPGHRVTVQCY